MSRFDYLLGRVTLDSANHHLYGGKLFADKELFESAIKHYKKGLQMYEQLLDANDPLIANAYLNYSTVLRRVGSYDEAADLCQKAVVIYSNNSDREKDVQNAYTHLGISYMRGGEKEKALEALLRSKALLAAQGNDVQTLASLLYYIGSLYNDMERFDEAWDALNQSYEMLSSLSEKDPTLEACLLLSMGVNLENTGNYEDALKYCTVAWHRQTEIKMSPLDIAVTEDHIASINERLGEWENAIKAYRLAISIYREGYYQDHLSLLNWYKKIGNIEISHGLYSEAKGDYLSALYHAKRLKDNSDFETADLYYAIGLTNYNAGEYYAACLDLKKALKLFQIDQIHHMRELALVYQQLGDCMAVIQNQKEKPEEYYLKAIACYHSITEQAPASLCLKCGIYLINAQRYKESQYCSEEALKGFTQALEQKPEENLENSNDSLFSTIDGIAQCHYNIGFVHYVSVEYVSAAKEFIRAYVWYKYTLPLQPENPSTAESLRVCEEQLKFIYDINSKDQALALNIFEKACKELEIEHGIESDEFNVAKQWTQYAHSHPKIGEY